MFCFKNTMWLKVKHLPENSSNWYSTKDRLLGYEEVGDSSNDAAPWALKFVGLPFSKFMFSVLNIRGAESLPLGANLWLILNRDSVMSMG